MILPSQSKVVDWKWQASVAGLMYSALAVLEDTPTPAKLNLLEKRANTLRVTLVLLLTVFCMKYR